MLTRSVRPWCTMGAMMLLFQAVASMAQVGDFTYITTNGTITITGYIGPGGDVTVPSTIDSLPVTVIGAEAFQYCSTLTSITIPDTVTGIGNYAFNNCSGLTQALIGNSVTSIPAGA